MLTRRAYYADHVGAPVIAGVCLALEVRAGGATVALAEEVVAGLALWTLVEYLLHRFVFHGVPGIREAHQLHHDRPAAYIGVSPLTTWPLMAATCFLFGAAGAGAVLGYLSYIWAHDRIHHAVLRPCHPLYHAKLRHRAHHAGLEANFGVVTPLWDLVFGTFQPVKAKGTTA